MTVKFSTAVIDGFLNSIEATMGTSPVLIIYSGTAPANCAAAATGTVLITFTLPSDWMLAASGGTKLLNGLWQAAASTGGIASHYRIYDSTQTTCHEQGTCTLVGGGGDMTLDTLVISSGQVVTIVTKTLSTVNI